MVGDANIQVGGCNALLTGNTRRGWRWWCTLNWNRSFVQLLDCGDHGADKLGVRQGELTVVLLFSVGCVTAVGRVVISTEILVRCTEIR